MKILDHLASLVWLVAVAAVMLVRWSSAVDGQSELRMSRAEAKPEAVVNAQGDLHVPSNYRAAYEFLGTWAIAAAKGVGSSELHNVYATPGTSLRSTPAATSLMERYWSKRSTRPRRLR